MPKNLGIIIKNISKKLKTILSDTKKKQFLVRKLGYFCSAMYGTLTHDIIYARDLRLLDFIRNVEIP